MSQQKNGGPAYPQIKTNRNYTTDIDVHSVGGMTLRDYFAAKALAGLIEYCGNHIASNPEAAATREVQS